MSAIIKVDTADLWELYLSISNVRDQAMEECHEITKVLNSLRERIAIKKKKIRLQIDQLQDEAARLRRKIQNKEGADSSTAADEARVQAIRAKISQLEQLLDDLGKSVNRISVYESKLQSQKKNCSNMFRAGKIKLSRYLSFLEKLIEDEEYNSYQNSAAALPSAESQSGQNYFVMKFRGVNFYCNDDELNLDGADSDNLERMCRGGAPIGIDGRPVNLHHMQQSESLGGVMELSEAKHTKNHAVLHWNSHDIPSGINRAAFENLKKSFWKRRALFIKRSRGM